MKRKSEGLIKFFMLSEEENLSNVMKSYMDQCLMKMVNTELKNLLAGMNHILMDPRLGQIINIENCEKTYLSIAVI